MVADHQGGRNQRGVNNIGRHPEVAAKRPSKGERQPSQLLPTWPIIRLRPMQMSFQLIATALRWTPLLEIILMAQNTIILANWTMSSAS